MISVVPAEVIAENKSVTPAAINIIDVIPDPNLESMPDASVNGTSGEFQYSHQPNNMQLNWTHSAGTVLNLQGIDDDTYPRFSDFVYFSQSFDWPYEEKPNDAEIYLNYSVSMSGSFVTEMEGGLMFRVHAWLIDSSNNWLHIYRSYPPYTTIYQERRVNLNYFDLDAGWGGMIEDTSGVQEDPLDELTLGIGLVPTEDFLNYLGDEPWQDYTGSVIVSVSSMNLYVIMDAEPDPATHLEPLYNATYGSILGDVYSSFTPLASTPLRDRVYSMTSDPEGNVYLTGETNVGYDIYQQTGISQNHQFILKYSPTLNRQWLVRNANQSRGRAITYHEGYLYTTGCNYHYSFPNYRDVIVTKWTLAGQKIWETEWGGVNDQVGVAIGVHNDGSIFVMVSDFNYRGPEQSDCYDNSTIMKLDGSGTVLWNKSIQLSTMQDASGELRVFESHILYNIQGLMLSLDLDGNILWDEASWAVTTDENGDIFSIFGTGLGIGVHRYTPDGNETWSDYFEIEYDNGWIEFLRVHDVTITRDNELLILVQGNMHDYSYHLVKYNLNGSHIQTWSIGSELWPWPTGVYHYMEATSTGLLYFSFTQQNSDIWTQGFAIGDYTLPIFSSDTMTIIAIGGGIGVIALVGVFVIKKKRAP